MNTELAWIGRPTTTGLYAAAAILEQWAPADGVLAEALAPAAEQLVACLLAAGAEPAAALAHLVPLSADPVSPRELATTTLNKCLGRQRGEPHVPALADAIRQLDAALLAARPKLAEELLLRRDVLREQWEARGPGLLYAVARLTDDAAVPARADVLLVHPLLGGGGRASIAYNRVTLEAVLANPHANLPEVARLGWLLSQLNLELPIFSELIAPGRLTHVAPLAMLCVTLQAAEEVELVHANEASVELALSAWRAEAGRLTPADVWNWWQSYLGARPSWPAALAALDRMQQ